MWNVTTTFDAKTNLYRAVVKVGFGSVSAWDANESAAIAKAMSTAKLMTGVPEFVGASDE